MAVDFNDTGSYFYEVGTDLNNLTTLTVMAWVYANAVGETGSRDVVTHWDYSNDKSWTLFYSTVSNVYVFEVAYDDGNVTDVASAQLTSTQIGKWQCIVGRWKATERSCWLDGVEGNKETTSRTSISDSAAELGISGQWNAGVRSSANKFDGRIALVTAWNYYLADDEIVALSNGAHPLLYRRDNLLFHMPLYDTSSINNVWNSGYAGEIYQSGHATADHPPVIHTVGSRGINYQAPATGKTLLTFDPRTGRPETV